MGNFWQYLTPGQIRFVSRVCRSILGFNDRRPKTFDIIVQIIFWVGLVAFSVFVTLRLAPYIRAIADDPVGALLWLAYWGLLPWILLAKLLIAVFHL